MKFTILSFLVLTASILTAQPNFSNSTLQDFNNVLNAHLSGNTEALRAYPIHIIHDEMYVSLLATTNSSFNPAHFTEQGIIIGSRVKNIVTIKYPINRILEVLQNKELDFVKMASRVAPSLRTVHYGTRVDSVWNGDDLPQGYTGKDVIIGVVDWGFDYDSPMYYDTNLNNSRVLAAWDQHKLSGPSPTGYNYGTSFESPSELAAAQSDTSGTFGVDWHGGHVAGIAGGSGIGNLGDPNNPVNRGMAPGAEFLFVTPLDDEGAILDGWNWMLATAKAEGKNIVVNGSWGGVTFNPLNGSDLFSQAVNALTKDGMLFCFAAGNNGLNKAHILHDFAADTIKSRMTQHPSSDVIGQHLLAWGESGKAFSTKIIITDMSNNLLDETAWYSTSSNTITNTYVSPTPGDTIWMELATEDIHPINGAPNTRWKIKGIPSNYKVGFQASASNGKVHFYNVSEGIYPLNLASDFTFLGNNSLAGDNNYFVHIPAVADDAIAVGNHKSEIPLNGGTIIQGGQMVDDSSVGPRVDGAPKPDVVAPGWEIVSVVNRFTDGWFSKSDSVIYNGETFYFTKSSGTSMSSPVVAGVAALLWEANPQLSPAQVKQCILTSARKDQHTGTTPGHSSVSGWGKINAHAAVKCALSTVNVNETILSFRIIIYPNPSNGIIRVKTPILRNASIRIIGLNGQEIQQYRNIHGSEFNWNHNLPNGVYILEIVDGETVFRDKFIVQL